MDDEPECAACNDTGTICLNCQEAIDDCECGEDAMPCLCDGCYEEEDR